MQEYEVRRPSSVLVVDDQLRRFPRYACLDLYDKSVSRLNCEIELFLDVPNQSQERVLLLSDLPTTLVPGFQEQLST